MKTKFLVAFAALSLAAPAMAAQSLDANPTVAFTYGAGNDYNPANAVVNTTAVAGVTTGELALRAHVPQQAAQSTGGTGIYTFALGSDVSFDYSFFGTDATNARVTVTNLLTNGTASYLAGLGSLNTSGAIQDSQQLGFGFLNGGFNNFFGNINFDKNVASTYRIDLAGGGQTVSAFAQLGAGGIAAVPEPATWAMMLFGMVAIGWTMRRKRAFRVNYSFA